jgi:general secretion pathway protein D
MTILAFMYIASILVKGRYLLTDLGDLGTIEDYWIHLHRMRKLLKKYACSKLALNIGVMSLTLALMPTNLLLANGALQAKQQSTAVAKTAAANSKRMIKIAPKGPVNKHDQTKRVWNLHDADIKAVITTMAQLTGQTFLIDPNINGRVSIVSKKPMTVDELYQVFLTMLQTLNYTAVHQGLVTRIVPATDAKQYANEVPQKKAIHRHLNQQVVVDVIPVQHVSALQLVTVLQPLVPNDSLITAYNPSNAIVVSGTAEMVKRVRSLVNSLDSQSGSELANVKLGNAKADDLVKLLQELQKNDQAEGKVNTVSYAADKDTNSILVSGSAANLKQAKALIEKLDQGSSKIDSGLTLIHLDYVSATTIVPILAKLAGGNVTSTGGSDSGSSAGGSPLGQSMLGGLSSGISGSMNNSTDSSNGNNSIGDSSGTPQIGSDISSIFQTDQVVSGGGKNFSLVAVPSTNNIIVSAPALMVKRLKQIVKLLDVRPKQVFVQALIVRVDQELMTKLGIQWGTKTANASGTGSSIAQNSGLISNMSISAIWTALQEDNNSDVLATPSIVVENNKKAMIADGESLSVPGNVQTTDNGTVQGYNQINIQLQLVVKPQINSNNSVTLTVAQQDNEIDQAQENELLSSGGSGSNAAPPIDTSSITTQVMVPDSDVLVLGGLLRKNRSLNKTGVPILSKIPILGRLFTFNDASHKKSNLLVFLKPTVLNNEKQDKTLSHHLYNQVRTGEFDRAAKDSADVSQLQAVLPRLTHPKVRLPQPFETQH